MARKRRRQQRWKRTDSDSWGSNALESHPHTQSPSTSLKPGVVETVVPPTSESFAANSGLLEIPTDEASIQELLELRQLLRLKNAMAAQASGKQNDTPVVTDPATSLASSISGSKPEANPAAMPDPASSVSEQTLSKGFFAKRRSGKQNRQTHSEKPGAQTHSKQEKPPSRQTNASISVDGDSATAPKKKKRKLARLGRYEILALVCLLLIWVPALLLFKKMPPVYKSGWTIMIPGTTSGSSINLDTVGEANTSTNSRYDGKAVDPKVNYKAILMSPPVLEKAAERSGMTVKEFGKPKIKLVDQTSMMEVMHQSDDPDVALSMTQSLYTVFMEEVTALRKDERLTKQAESNEQLLEYQDAVQTAQESLLQFKRSSEIVSSNQYEKLLEDVATVTEQKRNAQIRFATLSARYDDLQESLDMDPVLAGKILKLQQDLMVQSLVQEYAKAHASMVELRAVLGTSNPKYVHSNLRTGNARYALGLRAEEVLGEKGDEILDLIMPGASSTDSSLYSDLIRLQSEQAGLSSEIESLDKTLPELENSILLYSEQNTKLAELEQDYSIANTILVSATARLDLGKSDIYATYPMTQLLVPPSVPEPPSKLPKLFVLLGAAIGSFFVILGLIIIWNRKRWLRVIQKKR